MPCAGNSSETCGSADFITIFEGPNPPRAAQLPPNWSEYWWASCAQDSPQRIFTDTFIAGPELAAINTPAACVNLCAQKGYKMAGVEGGDECYCGNAFRVTPVSLPMDDCNLPCQGAIGTTCGGNFTIQLYNSS